MEKSFFGKGFRFFFYSFEIFLLLTGLKPLWAGGKCLDCHSGKDKRTLAISVHQTSVHRDLDCEDCHGSLAVPHPREIPPVQCGQCHDTQEKALQASSHGRKLEERLRRKGQDKPSALCLACHGEAHALLGKKDKESPTNRLKIVSTCLNCHKKAQPIAIVDYLKSVHGTFVRVGGTPAAVCMDCHRSHSIDQASLPTSKVFYQVIPQTCKPCHPREYADYTRSIHWKAVSRGFHAAPVCTDCHGEHGIRSRRDPLSLVWTGTVTKTCSACHASKRLAARFMIPSDRVTTFEDSFHGLSGQLGDIRVANCSSCHGNHAILPSSDPNSTISPGNMSKTCGKCHPGAEKRFISGRVHVGPKHPSYWLVGVVRKIYIWLIVLVIGGMLVHNGLDLIGKSAWGLSYKRQEVLSPRFSIHERIQHGCLAFCFMALVVSGFALRFPHSPFAWPFEWLSMGIDIRRWMHRVCGFILIGLAGYHGGYLFFSRRGRKQWNALKPRWQDMKEAGYVFARYFSRVTNPIELSHYTYIEKMEYWALVWGTLVMAVTGLFLYFINTALAHFPLWVVDLATTIHFWEAVLATLAILIWHGYWVIFDPEIYPLNLTWIIGKPRPSRGKTLKEG